MLEWVQSTKEYTMARGWQSIVFEQEDNVIVGLGLEALGHKITKFLTEANIQPEAVKIQYLTTSRVKKFDPPEEKQVISCLVLYYK